MSGSVGLELLYRLKPTVVVYRLGRVMNFVLRRLVHVRFMSLVNLLADDEVYPEFATPRDESGAIAGHVLRWLSDPAARSATVARLRALRDAVAVPGACDRAAAFLTDAVGRRAAAAA